MNRISWLLKRAKEILQTEGFIPLVRRGFSFVGNQLFSYRTYYLFEHTLKERNETEFFPKMQNFVLKMISATQELEELTGEGFSFQSRYLTCRERLGRGAIAVCIFVDRELAHIAWFALTKEAKAIINEPPLRVDFSKNEACHGGTWTSPKYRGMRLAAYAGFKGFNYLWQKGMVVSRAAAAKDNAASERSYAMFGPRIYAEARHLKILWWESWKEKPLP